MKNKIWVEIDVMFAIGFLITVSKAEINNIHIHIMFIEISIYWGDLDNINWEK